MFVTVEQIANNLSNKPLCRAVLSCGFPKQITWSLSNPQLSWLLGYMRKHRTGKLMKGMAYPEHRGNIGEASLRFQAYQKNCKIVAMEKSTQDL